MIGTEWVVKKSNVSEAEFKGFSKNFVNFAKTKLAELNFTNKAEYKDRPILILTKDSKGGNMPGYLKLSNGRIQVVLLSADKKGASCPCNVEFRVFLSNIENLSALIKRLN